MTGEEIDYDYSRLATAALTLTKSAFSQRARLNIAFVSGDVTRAF
jgi:hypothetical protein